MAAAGRGAGTGPGRASPWRRRCLPPGVPLQPPNNRAQQRRDRPPYPSPPCVSLRFASRPGPGPVPGPSAAPAPAGGSRGRHGRRRHFVPLTCGLRAHPALHALPPANHRLLTAAGSQSVRRRRAGWDYDEHGVAAPGGGGRTCCAVGRAARTWARAPRRVRAVTANARLHRAGHAAVAALPG